MGHERLGALPKSKPWKEVVSLIGEYADGRATADDLASRIVENVDEQFRHLSDNKGTQIAFKFLVDLTVACRQREPEEALREMGVGSAAEPSALNIATALSKKVDEEAREEGSREEAEIARSAAADTIAEWEERNRFRQGSLFDEPQPSHEIWKLAGDGGGFTDLAQLFFSRFTERYLEFYLDREASAEISDIDTREDLHQAVVDHAEEVSGIIKHFAAGWYNKHAAESAPSHDEVRGFLNHAFGKIRGELTRGDRDG